MKSKMSFFNPGIQKQNAKQHGWVGLIFLIGWLFALPLQMILLAEDEERVLNIEHMYDITQGPQMLLMAGVPVLAAIFLFRYLQVPDAADMMHSLPVKRESLLFNQLVSGTIMLVVPILITAVAVSLVSGAYPVYGDLTGTDISNWVGIAILMSLFFFLFTVLVGMITGISVATGILTFILLMLPVGLFSLINSNLALYLYGFSSAYRNTEQAAQWSPIVVLTELGEKSMSLGQVIGFIAAVVISGAAALVLYKYRHIETASQAITFTALQPIFKYGVTFCAMLTGGLYYNQYGSIGWVIFGYIFGSIVGYLIAEMILKKTWRVFRGKLFLGYAGYAVVIILLGILVNYDAFGFEKAVPETNEIEGVYFGHNAYQLTQADQNEQNPYNQSEAYIEKVRNLHETIVEKQPQELPAQFMQRTDVFVIAYELENGGHMIREYQHLPSDEIKSGLKAVLEQEAYKSQEYELDKLNDKVSSVEFVPNIPGAVQPALRIEDQEEIEELQEIMKYEISSIGYENILNQGMVWGNIQFHVPGDTEEEAKSFDLPYHKSFEEVDTWLKNNGYLEQARLTIEQVDRIEIAHVPRATEQNASPVRIFREQVEQGNAESIEINNEEEKNHLFNHFSDFGRGDYVVKIMFDGSETTFGSLQEEQVPESIQAQFD
ncbi:hypothetical protein [Salibacterium aidingense]|uniref:hypothetical protein n=1 Tax=Salibacterium aidingense TaxID=384933 RepID=UPI003BDBE880